MSKVVSKTKNKTDAVDADDVFDAEARHPGDALDELHFALGAVERGKNLERPGEAQSARRERKEQKRAGQPARHQQ